MSRLLTLRPGILARVSAWQVAAVSLAAVFAVVLIGYRDTVVSLVSVWAHTGTFQYAFFIFPLSAWTAFGLRQQLLAAPPQPSVSGLPLIAVLGFVWFTGHQVNINLLQHAALVAMFPAAVLAVWGWRAVRVLAFPLGYLVFAVPWGNSLVGPLQTFTAHFAVRALELIGTPVLLNGHEIITPTAVWLVADACSGIKFFIACTALGCLYAYLMYRRWWKRVLFVMLAAVVPVIANGLRVFITVLIGDTWGLKYATGTDHLIFGWQFFGTVLLILLAAGWLFRDPLRAIPPVPHDGGRLSSRHGAVWATAMVLVIAGPVFAAWLKPPAVAGVNLQLSAPRVPGWDGPQTAPTDWRPQYAGTDAEMHAVYRNDARGTTVEVFGALYIGGSRRGHDLITYGNNVYDPATATVLGTATRQITLGSSAAFPVQELRLSTASGTRLVWYWYCIDGRCTDSGLRVKLEQSLDALRGRSARASVWAVSALVAGGDLPALRNRLETFLRAAPDMTGQMAESAGGEPAQAEPRP
ncbi:MAG: EpsI family protein [Gammaproteobacteria bacterium]|nr:EpsI family protein [Gammaproteobacteria bacterium]